MADLPLCRTARMVVARRRSTQESSAGAEEPGKGRGRTYRAYPSRDGRRMPSRPLSRTGHPTHNDSGSRNGPRPPPRETAMRLTNSTGLALAAMAGLALAAPAARADVRDHAKLFSPEAVQKANAAIGEIKQ